MKRPPDLEPRAAFDRQVETLLVKGYPELAGLDEAAFLEHVAPLEERLADLPARTAFAIVVKSALVPREQAMALVELNGKQGFTSMEEADLERFTSVDGVELPEGAAYLVAGLDTGSATLNVTPDAALETIVAEHRSPLTIDEGVALITHHPEVLKTENCSRCSVLAAATAA
jgi:hypothetical protein